MRLKYRLNYLVDFTIFLEIYHIIGNHIKDSTHLIIFQF